jgi:hypothetical protein
MRGYPSFNWDAFNRAASKLRDNPAIGDIHNPAEMDAELGIQPDQEITNRDLRGMLAMDLKVICEECDVMYMLVGWEKSWGAKAEHALATALGMQIWYER